MMGDQAQLNQTGSAYYLPEPSFDPSLVLVDRGTPMGEMLRRYWHAVYKSDKLTDLPVKVKALGEEVILFRKPTGEVGALYPRCIHRGTDLIWGKPTEGGLRCCYHGWTFETDGTCTAQPCEPNNGGKGRNAVRQPWYPAEELYGLIFIYMGPPDRKPPLPRFDLLEDFPDGMELYVDDTTIPSAGAGHMPCNWLQHHENGMDPAHVPIVHERQFPPILAKAEMETKFEKLPDRIHGTGLFKLGPEMLDFQVEIMLPIVRIIPHPLLTNLRTDGKSDNVMWTLPKDNHDTIVFTVGVKPIGFDMSAIDDLYDGKRWVDMSFEEHQRHPGDFEAQVGQGLITFHSEEHLVSSDKGVVFVRRMLQSAVRDVAEGRDPPMTHDLSSVIVTTACARGAPNPDYVPNEDDEAPTPADISTTATDPSGRWELTLPTPVGEQVLTLETRVDGSALSGSLTDGEDPIAIHDGRADGAKLTFKANVRKPLPMTMTFDLAIAGDAITGTFKPGMFPKGKLTGKRLSATVPA